MTLMADSDKEGDDGRKDIDSCDKTWRPTKIRGRTKLVRNTLWTSEQEVDWKSESDTLSWFYN